MIERETIVTPTQYWFYGVVLAVLFPPSVFYYVNNRVDEDEIEHYGYYFSLHWLLTICGWTPGTVVAIYYLKRNSEKALRDYEDALEYQAQCEELRTCLIPIRIEESNTR